MMWLMVQEVINLPFHFEPRPYQLPILQALDGGTKRAILVWARRSGKDIVMWNWMIRMLAEKKSIGYYVMPTYAQAKKVIWDSMTTDGMKFLDFIPKSLIDGKPNQQEMKIKLYNGSILQLIGSDNVDSIMGTNPQIVVFSEFALQSQKVWDYVRPILSINKGYAIFVSTPRGKNHFYDLYTQCQGSPNWFTQKLTVDDTKLMSPEDIQRERDEGMSEELIQQEYFVSFDRGVEGSYYGKLIDRARHEGRICNVQYDPAGVVNTAWDIGYGDATAIVFWQNLAGETRIIDYYEAQGEALAHYAKMVQEKPYLYGTHFFPHDAAAGSLQTGTSIQRLASDLGIKAVVLPRDELETGIEQTRSLLATAFIDEKKCKHLIKCLENYHKRFNESTNSYSETPIHDDNSHGADATRYMAIARNRFGSGSQNLTPDKIKEMRQKNLGW